MDAVPDLLVGLYPQLFEEIGFVVRAVLRDRVPAKQFFLISTVQSRRAPVMDATSREN